MKTPMRTHYKNTDRNRVSCFFSSLEISEIEKTYATSILGKSSFSARDLKVLLQIVASKAQISPFQLETLGLPTFVHAVHQEMAQ